MTLWKNSKFDLISSLTTHHSIKLILRIIGTNEIICITIIYAPHKVVGRIKMLQSISNLLDPLQLPLKIIAYEFNKIKNLSEKKVVSRSLERMLRLSLPPLKTSTSSTFPLAMEFLPRITKEEETVKFPPIYTTSFYRRQLILPLGKWR